MRPTSWQGNESDGDPTRARAGGASGSRPFQARFALGMAALAGLLLAGAALAARLRPDWVSSLLLVGGVLLASALGVWWVSRLPDDLEALAGRTDRFGRRLGQGHGKPRRIWRRSIRRRLLAAAVLFLVLEVALLSRPGRFALSSADALSWIWIVAAMLFLSLSPYRVDRARWKHDERQAALWDGAHRIAYQILASLGGLYLFVRLFVIYPLYGPLYGMIDVALLPPGSASLLGLQVLFTVFILPAAVMAWIEPDPPQEESRGTPRRHLSVLPGGRGRP